MFDVIAQVESLEQAAGADSLTLDSAILGGAVLLLDRRAHVADPRRLHELRGRRRAPQERDGDGDEEHPHDRRGHADLLLLRLVDLQLQPAGPADRAEQHRLHRRGLPGRHPVERRVRAEPDEQHQPHLLPGLPAVLVDDRVDHVGSAARARAALGLPRARGAARLGRLDPGRGVGLERRRLDDAAVRLPRLDRVRRSSTAWPARSRSACCSTSGRGSASTRRTGWPGPSDPTTCTSRCWG